MPEKLIVDCHVHVTPRGQWFDTDLDASLDRLLYELDSSCVEKAVLLPVGKDEVELIEVNNFIIALISRYPDKFIGLSAYYSGLSIDQVLKNNLIGIKIHPRQNKLDILDQKLFPIYEAAALKGLPILFDSYCTPVSDMPLEKIRPVVYGNLASLFPSLKIIMAHCGMPFIWETYVVLKWYQNVFADLSHILQYFKNTSLLNDLAWVVRKIPHKFIYGSDFPEMGIKSYFEQFGKFCKIHNIPSKGLLKNFYKVTDRVI